MFNKKSLNKFVTGFVTGLILPVIIFLGVWIFSSKGTSLAAYIDRILIGNLLTHFISLCVFPNVFVFLVFNRFDLLKSSKGVLAITIIWALVTFITKFS